MNNKRRVNILNKITTIKNKTMFYNTPIFIGDIAIRDHVQYLAQCKNKKVLVITDSEYIYENMPNKNIKTISLFEIENMDFNENLIYELQDYLNKDGVILVRIFDEPIEVTVSDAINSLYSKTRGTFIYQMTDEVDEELKHREEVDLGEFLWLKNEN